MALGKDVADSELDSPYPWSFCTFFHQESLLREDLDYSTC